jgi:hypothetical protein
LPAIARKPIESQPIHFRLGVTEYARLTYHAHRLGWELGELIRHGMHEYLNRLDDQEAAERAQRAARTKTKAPKMGGLPGGVEATGITFKRTDPTPPTGAAPADPKIPEKLTNSFDRFFREVDSAEKLAEKGTEARARSIAIQNVLLDLLERSPTEEIANFVFVKFQEQLKSRDATKSVKFEKAPEDVPIDGGDDA